MAYNPTVRTMRDGILKIKDGSSTPQVCTVVCDEGNVSWTVAKETVPVLCRGVVTQLRKGADQPCEVTFTVKWTQLIQKVVDDSDPIVPYEILMNEGDDFTSTSLGDYTVDIEFTCTDPANGSSTDELVLFADAVITSCSPSEGEENTIEVTAQIPAVKPTISRVA